MRTREELEQRYVLVVEPYDPDKGYPARPDLVYRCRLCDTFMDSQPAEQDDASCQCDHISIDLGYSRLSVGGIDGNKVQPELFRLVEKGESADRNSEFVLQPASGIRLSLNVIWWWQPLFYFTKPVVEVNGHPQPARWGKQDVPLMPGNHQLRVHFPYMSVKQCGPAEIDIQVPQGQWINVAYTPPFTMFQRGKLRVKTR